VNNPNDQLDLLLHAARGLNPHRPSTPPFGLETRVLAAWRSSRGAPLWDTGVLVRGLAVATFLVLASCWPAFEQGTNSDSENLQLADSSLQSDLTP
jgi:hypothetical protein